MKIHRYILPFLALLLASSCEKVIELPDSGFEPMLVMNAIVQPDSTLSVRLTRSQFLLDDNPFQGVGSASLSLSVNGSDQSALAHSDGGDYTFAYTPSPGDSLHLRCAAPGLPSVEASTRVVAMPALRDIAFRKLYYDDYDADTVYSLRFTLDDPAHEANYYGIYILCLDSALSSYPYLGTADTTVDERDVYITCRDAMLTRPGGMSVEGTLDDETLLFWFSDAAIDGHSHEVSLTFSLQSLAHDYYNTKHRRGLYLEVYSYSFDLYRYAVDLYNSDTDDEFGGFLSEPQPVHTNVRGGTGIFGSAATTRIPLR